MEGESGATRSIIEKVDNLDIERDQMEGESGFTRSVIDGLHFLDIQRD